MRIVLLCATRRGCLFLQKLAELSPDADLVVFSFREEPWEPPFLEDLRELTLSKGGQFFEAKQVGSESREGWGEATAVDLMLVVGGKMSSNTKRLFEICKAVNKNTYHIESECELSSISFERVKTVGIAAGASTPDWIVDDIKRSLCNLPA